MVTVPPLICRNSSEIEAGLTQRCLVCGIFEVRPFYTKKGSLFRVWPVVVLDDGTEVLIGSLWDEAQLIDGETIERLTAKSVEVIGPLHGQPPGSIQNISIPCISPVEHLGEVE